MFEEVFSVFKRLFSVRIYAGAWTVKTLKDQTRTKRLRVSKIHAGRVGCEFISLARVTDGRQNKHRHETRDIFTAEISDGFRRERRRKSSFFKDQEANFARVDKTKRGQPVSGNFAQRCRSCEKASARPVGIRCFKDNNDRNSADAADRDEWR